MSFIILPRVRVALAAVAILAVAGASAAVAQSAPTQVEAAGSNLMCDQNTLYGITSGGDVIRIDATTGTTIAEISMSPATNALGVSPDGTAAWAFQSGNNNIVRYDPMAGTTATIVSPDPDGVQTTIRGAINPVNGYYYYAGGGNSARLAAYNTTTGTAIGQVGTITGLGGNNGDMAFGSDGTLYLVDGDTVYNVGTVPTTAGSGNITATPIVTLPGGTNSPGIAYSSDGYLFLAESSASSNIFKINPSSGALVATVAISTAQPVVDLATCNYANSLRGQVDVHSRAASTDQFTITNSGNGITTGNTATTTGTATGIQSAVAGPNLTVGGLNYSVTLSAAGTANPANYSIGWECVNLTNPTQRTSGTGGMASFTNPVATTAEGSDVVCTFLAALNPVAAADGYATPIDTTLTVNAATGLLANDSGADITAAITTQPSHGTITVAADGSFVYVPTTGFTGPDSFTYTITDANGTTSTATATIQVNPIAANDSYSTPANTPLTISDLSANDTPTTMTVQSVTTPSHGTAVLQGGSVIYTPTTGYSGPDSFNYTTVDSNGQSATATVTIAVDLVAVDDAYTTPIDTTLTVVAADGVLDNDTGSSITRTANTTPSHGTVTVAADGSFVYVPTTGFTGTDTFDYTITDASGATATATATVQITPVAADDSYTAPAEAPLVITDLTANDGPSTMTVQSVTTPSHGTAVLGGNGSVTYTPDAGYVGPDSFDYTAIDTNGQPTTATVTITVEAVAVDDTFTTPADTALSNVDLTTNDRPSPLTVQSITTPSHGTAVLNSDGTVTYTPTAGYVGPDSFDYTAIDTNGQPTTATVSITVAAKAVDDQMTASGNDPTLLKPLLNDTPTAGSTFDPATLRIFNPATNSWVAQIIDPAVGTWTVVGGEIQFIPVAGYSGTAEVQYEVTDTAGNTVTAKAFVFYLPTAALASTNVERAGLGAWALGFAGLLLGLALLMLSKVQRRLRSERTAKHRVSY